MELQQQKAKLLNPNALEFTPCISCPSPWCASASASASATPNHLPQPHYYYQHQLPPPSPPYFYYQQAPPVTVNYHQYKYNHLFVCNLPPSSAQPPKSHDVDIDIDIYLPLADEDLGLLTSPTCARPRKSRIHRSRHHNHNNTGRLVWVKKNTNPLSSYPFGDFTSLMIRNIPVRLSRRELMKMLDDHCSEENEKGRTENEGRSEFDFLYLPVDFTRKGNLGYAFVNFTSWQGASRLYNSWRGTKWVNCDTKKICFIHAAKYQGEMLKRHFEGSHFKCDTDEYLPVKFQPPRNGTNGDVTKLITIGTRISMLSN